MSGLDNTGFSIKRLPDIVASLQTLAQTLFSDLVPAGDVVNVDGNSTLGRLIGLVSPSYADLWEAAQEDYDAMDIFNVTGVALDNLVALGGITRKQAAPTSDIVVLAGSVGTTIPANSTVSSTSTGNSFLISDTQTLSASSAVACSVTVTTVANTTDYSFSYQKVPDVSGTGVVTTTITSSGSATSLNILTALASAINSAHGSVLTATVDSNGILQIVNVDNFQKINFSTSSNLGIPKAQNLGFVNATVNGPLAQAPHTITTIATPVFGWDSVDNPSTATLGQLTETDAALRTRYFSAKFTDGVNTVESLYAAILNLNNVSAVRIYENDTDTTGITGVPSLPPHSFYPVVLGGSTQDIGNAIWNNKPAGILSFGDTSANILDSQGVQHTVSFKRPTTVDIYISLSITVLSNFAPNGVQAIKDALVAYFAANFSIGQDVIYSRLYTPINSVVGHYINSLTIGTAPSPSGTSNITITSDQLAALSEANIIITEI